MPTTASSSQIGSSPPDFVLPDTRDGSLLSLGDCTGDKGLLAMFLCNHCPYVRHLENAISALAREYQNSGIGILAISANDPVSHPQDHPDRMKERAAELDYCFPYLFDETQKTARQWGAVCTPEFFLYDTGLQCVYHGRFDDSSPGNDRPVTGTDLRQAMEGLLAGRAPKEQQYSSMGCSIKWKT